MPVRKISAPATAPAIDFSKLTPEQIRAIRDMSKEALKTASQDADGKMQWEMGEGDDSAVYFAVTPGDGSRLTKDGRAYLFSIPRQIITVNGVKYRTSDFYAIAEPAK